MQSAAQLQTAMIGALTRARTTQAEQAEAERVERERRLKSEADIKRAAEDLDAIPAFIEKMTLEQMCGGVVMKIGPEDHVDLAPGRRWTPSSNNAGLLIGAAKLVFDRLKETGFEVSFRDREISINWARVPKALA